MSVRDRINANPGTVAIGVAVVLLLTLVIVFWQNRDTGPPPASIYYYDLDTGRVFTTERQEVPLVITPNEAQSRGVVAHIFACGECPSVDLSGMSAQEIAQAGAFLGYVETMPKRAREVIERYQGVADLTPEQQHELMRAEAEGRIVARADDMNQWYPVGSPAFFEQIARTLEQRCSGQERSRACRP